jgi:hypothetical protein
LPNEIIYYQGWGKLWIVGSIQSQGKYVVGEDKNKTFIKNGKWYWKAKNSEIKTKLAKFFFILGKPKRNKKQLENNSNSPPIKVSQNNQKQVKITLPEVKVLNVVKTPLPDFLKIFCLDKNKRKLYFLLNTYQKPNILPNLQIGSTRSVLLVRGRKHGFFSKML